MGRYYGIIAIKNSAVEEILDLTSKYYATHNIEIKEIVYGGGESKYSDGSNYADIAELKNDRNSPLYKAEGKHSKTFSFYQDLEENKAWSIFIYAIRKGTAPLRPDTSLVSHLSKELKTQALEFSVVDSTGTLSLHVYQEGAIVDSLEVLGLDVINVKGHFESLKTTTIIDTDSLIDNHLRHYFEQMAFFPDSDEIMDFTEPGKWRPFYLDGDDNSIINYINSL